MRLSSSPFAPNKCFMNRKLSWTVAITKIKYCSTHIIDMVGAWWWRKPDFQIYKCFFCVFPLLTEASIWTQKGAISIVLPQAIVRHSDLLLSSTIGSGSCRMAKGTAGLSQFDAFLFCNGNCHLSYFGRPPLTVSVSRKCRWTRCRWPKTRSD